MSSSEPLISRYLWAVGSDAVKIPPGTQVADRYKVIAPQIWLDTQPELLPEVPEVLPEISIPYLCLYSHRLHIPEVYGFCGANEAVRSDQILLLENVPIDADGNLYPAIATAWPTVTGVRQVYWLWQLIELWRQLLLIGVGSSLLDLENIRVQGWRVWLRELYTDPLPKDQALSAETQDPVDQADVIKVTSNLRLQDLGYCWFNLITKAQPEVAPQLKEICRQMRQNEASLEAIAKDLNQLLITTAAKLPLRFQIASGTDTGPSRQQNEDSYYPTLSDIQNRRFPPHDRLIPYLTIVCDGVGGHEGGEVASLLAVQSLKALVQTLLQEITAQTEPTSPEIVIKQIEEIVKVVNNTIAAQNNTQNREARQRMGTTLVMTLQLPQPIGENIGNSHEMYLATVGDSRAYWITADYCHQLSIDDDVAPREVQLGRSPYRHALQRRDAGALTQALGTRDGEFVHPDLQRFIIEEDGLLLLCSDGLSDNNWVERSWTDYAAAVLNGEISLETATKFLIELANEKNGHDNTSVVLTYCRVSTEPLVLFDTSPVPETEESLGSELTDASKSLLYDESVQILEQNSLVKLPNLRERRRRNYNWGGIILLLAMLFVLGVIGFTAWQISNPQGSDVPGKILKP